MDGRTNPAGSNARARRPESQTLDLFRPPPTPQPGPLTTTTFSEPTRTAPDRPPMPPGPPLAGDYARHGANLRRDDGRVLVVCLSTKPPTARRPARYVKTAATGSAIRYCGSLYDDAATGRDALDGCQFQDRDDRTRYAIRRTGPDRYAVQPVSRRRGRGRS